MARIRRRRVGASEAVGTLLTIGITLVTGSAVWGYVNAQAGTTALNYASIVGGTDNFLAENFKVSGISFSGKTASGIPCLVGYCSIVFWLYNIGALNVQISQVRLSDTTGQINLLYNFTKTGSGQGQFVTNYLYDLRSTTSTLCKTAADSYESPVLTAVKIPIQNAQAVTLTIPNPSSRCLSFGQSFNSGTTYVLRIVGVYDSVVTAYQMKA